MLNTPEHSFNYFLERLREVHEHELSLVRNALALAQSTVLEMEATTKGGSKSSFIGAPGLLSPNKHAYRSASKRQVAAKRQEVPGDVAGSRAKRNSWNCGSRRFSNRTNPDMLNEPVWSSEGVPKKSASATSRSDAVSTTKRPAPLQLSHVLPALPHPVSAWAAAVSPPSSDPPVISTEFGSGSEKTVETDNGEATVDIAHMDKEEAGVESAKRMSKTKLWECQSAGSNQSLHTESVVSSSAPRKERGSKLFVSPVNMDSVEQQSPSNAGAPRFSWMAKPCAPDGHRRSSISSTTASSRALPNAQDRLSCLSSRRSPKNQHCNNDLQNPQEDEDTHEVYESLLTSKQTRSANLKVRNLGSPASKRSSASVMPVFESEFGELQTDRYVFEVRKAYELDDQPNPKLTRQLTRDRDTLTKGPRSAGNTADSNAPVFWLDKFVSPPNSMKNFYFDCLSMLMIAYDIVVIPLQVFQPPDTVFLDVMRWFTTVFWTSDLIRGFFTGYFSHGNVIVTFSAVRKMYLSRYFVLDCCILFHDWATVIIKLFSISDKLLDALESSEAFRLLRVMKAVRLIKTMEDRIHSEFFSVVWQVTKFFSGILVLNHLAACGWYWTGKASEDTHPTWIEEFIKGRLQNTFHYRYTTSFHWALTQFTPASIEIQPLNVYERIFAIIVLLFALLTTSTFVSGMTSSVMRLGALKSAKSKQFWLLRRYLKESKVPTNLAVRIHHYCDFAWDLQQSGVQEQNVQLLSLLSASLRAELRTAIFEPSLETHPFFVLIKIVGFTTMQNICNSAIVADVLGRGDTLFNRGEEAECMFYFSRGSAVYYFQDENVQDIGVGVWLCEPALWTVWGHQGSMQTRSIIEISAIDVERFSSILHTNKHTQTEASEYAKAYINLLNKLPTHKISDLYQSPIMEATWVRLWTEYGHNRPSNSGQEESMLAQRVMKKVRNTERKLGFARWFSRWKGKGQSQDTQDDSAAPDVMLGGVSWQNGRLRTPSFTPNSEPSFSASRRHSRLG